MPTGFKIAAGTDLDDIFDPYFAGAKPANTGLRTSDAVDLANRYAPLTFGSQAAATGFKIASGADVNTLWAAKGTASYELGIDGGNFVCTDKALTQQQNISAALEFSMFADGSYHVRKIPGTSAAAILFPGTWNNYGRPASDFEVLFTSTYVMGSEVAAVTNNAATWQPMTMGRTIQAKIGPYNAVNAGNYDSEMEVRVQIRIISTGQVVSDSTCHFILSATGFV